jgi:hypothetical protein
MNRKEKLVLGTTKTEWTVKKPLKKKGMGPERIAILDKKCPGWSSRT